MRDGQDTLFLPRKMRDCGRTVWLVTAVVLLGVANKGLSQVPCGRDGALAFDMAGQKLETALLAFGKIANIQVLYDSSLVTGRRSAAVRGCYATRTALDILLRDTGLRATYASKSAVTLSRLTETSSELLTLDTMRAEAEPMLGDSRRFIAYGNALQAMIIDALQRDSATRLGSYQLTVRIWVAADGSVERAETVRSTGDGPQIVAAMKVIRAAVATSPPPGGMPQPVTYQFRASESR